VSAPRPCLPWSFSSFVRSNVQACPASHADLASGWLLVCARVQSGSARRMSRLEGRARVEHHEVRQLGGVSVLCGVVRQALSIVLSWR
jgi:hypothetical protein